MYVMMHERITPQRDLRGKEKEYPEIKGDIAGFPKLPLQC